MKAPQVSAPLLAVLALSLAAYAGDSWQNKPSSQWNDKEIRTVLEKSPWAHRENLTLVSPSEVVVPCKRNTICSQNDLADQPPPAIHRRPVGPADIQNEQSRQAASSLPFSGDGVGGTAVVRWASARIVREAMARIAGKAKAVAVSKNEPPPLSLDVAYVVYVDLRVHMNDVKKVRQDGVLTAAMMRSSILVLKGTGQRIQAVRVTSAPLPQFDDRKELALAAYYIYFPREKDGKPVLSGDKEIVHFECPQSPGPISADFDLRAMKRDGHPDL